MTGLKISSSGMAANKKRMGRFFQYCNAQTTRTPREAVSQKEVVLARNLRVNLSEMLEGSWENAQTVQATEVLSTDKPPVLKYEPNHPKPMSKVMLPIQILT